MIISEKQILQLMELANAYIYTAATFGDIPWHIKDVKNLINTITNQQSQELKVIE